MRPSIELDPNDARQALVSLLQGAHAGELGAARAYAGHWRSLRKLDEIAEIRRIELDELDHRARVGDMLRALDAEPEPWRERLMLVVGTTISWLCRVGGWLIPMYGAGRLERGNVREYEDAARFAVLSGYPRFVPELLHMAEVEWDHERYFRSKVETHRVAALVPLWAAPAPRETIRESFEDFLLLLGSWRRRLTAPARQRSPRPHVSCRRDRTHGTVSGRIQPNPCLRISPRSPARYSRW